MAAPEKSIAAFPAWALLNGIDTNGLKLDHVPGKGFGFVAAKDLTTPLQAASEASSTASENVLRVPRDLILSCEAVDDYAKIDQNFRQLLDVAGRQSARAKIVLYLFGHIVSNRRAPDGPKPGIASTAWTEYIKLLPHDIPVPSLWSEDDQNLLQGTSLEFALQAKLAALEAEFESLRENTTNLSFWNVRWWEKETATIEDWCLADAWYRSRCLELPQAGEAMVPGLDMVNHSYDPTALYEELNSGDVVLQIRQGSHVAQGQEVTISYGQTKSAAEMLFSYGFIDEEHAARELTIPLEPMPDDPLGRAKQHAFGSPPMARIAEKDGTFRWESPFLLLMCLNEEDGLDFRLLQDEDGGRHLRVFWQDDDVTEQVDSFEDLVQGHPLEAVFRLRTVALLEQIVESQLERIRRPLSGVDPEDTSSTRSCAVVALTLRAIEARVLEGAFAALQVEKTTLLSDPRVLVYLGQMEDIPNEKGAAEATNEEPDFS